MSVINRHTRNDRGFQTKRQDVASPGADARSISPMGGVMREEKSSARPAIGQTVCASLHLGERAIPEYLFLIAYSMFETSEQEINNQESGITLQFLFQAK